MTPAIDTIGWKETAGGGGADTTFQSVVVAPGDSLTVRNFNPAAGAFMLNMFGSYSTAGMQERVRSPLMHDNVQGIKMIPGETPTRLSLPRDVGQMLRPQDTLIAEMISNATSEVVAGGLMIYYGDMPGANGRFKMWGDIAGIIKNIKPMLVAATKAGTTGQWNDTVITTSEDLLKANTDYAILGVTTDAAFTIGAIKGADLGNLRCPFPGDVRTDLLQDWFVQESNRHGLPMIPIINSANKNNTYVSLLDRITTTTPNVQLILAELAHTV